MRDLTRRQAILTGAAGAAAAVLTALPDATSALATQAGPNDRLWYRTPADTERDALVIGNGRLGAMVAGRVRDETIPLNEDTLWCGQPHELRTVDGRPILESVRAAVFGENYELADDLVKKLQGPFSHSYAPMANLKLAFEHDGEVTDYRRILDLDEAVARVEYSVNGARFTREFFVSHPSQLVILRFRSSVPGGLRFTAELESLLRHDVNIDEYGITLAGKAPTYCAPNYKHEPDPVRYSEHLGQGMTFAVRLSILSLDGASALLGKGLRLNNATEVVLAISAATGFRAFDVMPDKPLEDVVADALRPLASAQEVPFDTLRTQHVEDHRSFYRRMSVRLGNAPASPAPTDERLAANKVRPEPALAALYSNFSRYLLIASSRAGTQPANLQGIWSWELRPPWSSNYTTNINIQENYWGAEVCNLADLHGPMIDYIEQVAKAGTRTARELYGLDGWCVHHNSDIWRLSAPVGEGKGAPTWANFSLAGPWLCRHLWEHYLYSQDRHFLQKRAYPILKGCAQFCEGWLVRDPRNGCMTTAPSVSTENSFTGSDGKRHFVSAGSTADIAMIRELFSFTVAAAALLGVDVEFAGRLESLMRQLPGYKVGKHGQLQEWEHDFGEPEPEQRHISHLYPVAPGWEITPRSNPLLAKAARVSLLRRLKAGGAETGWSKAWAVHVFARLGDAEPAHDNLNGLLSLSTTSSLLDILPSANGPLFQIDGNFAGGSAVIEMILQSHDGVIAFLPALPMAWSDGALQGVRARGGLTLDMAWAAGRMTRARIQATRDGLQSLSCPPGQEVKSVRTAGRNVTILSSEKGQRISTIGGKIYDVEFK